jgi:hypothetical protein
MKELQKELKESRDQLTKSEAQLTKSEALNLKLVETLEAMRDDMKVPS